MASAAVKTSDEFSAEYPEDSPDIEHLMAQIREKVRSSYREGESAARKTAYQPRAPKEGERVSPLIYAEELNYINSHWNDWFTAAEITSHRPVVGKVIVRLKKFFLDLAWKYMLKEYVERERQFQMNLVRHLNATAKYIDARDAEIFWQLVEKIDNDVTGMNERIDRLYDEATATMRSVEKSLREDLTSLTGQHEQVAARMQGALSELSTLDGALRGLERTVALATREPVDYSARDTGGEASSSHEQPKMWPVGSDGVQYLLFENRFRGDEAVIKERVRDYVKYFSDAGGLVIDIGCGRGEFLEVLGESGIKARGVDIDTAMSARAKEKGLDVVEANCLDYLEEAEDGSLGGIFGAQLVEHLQRSDLERLLSLARRKVHPGGYILLETINPQSFAALARNFFRDPTHIWPIHPDTLSYMLEMQGLSCKEVLDRAPYPDGAILQKVDVSPHLPARWQIAMQGLNDNIIRLNDLLFGHQDYCVVGVVPGKTV